MFKAVVLSMLLTSCAVYENAEIHVGVFHDFDRDIDGDNPVAVVDIMWQITDSTKCGAKHLSHYTSGTPFNNNKEENMNAFGCFIKIK